MNTLLLALAIGLACVLVLFFGGLPTLNALVKGPLQFTETPGGSSWFGPGWKRAAFHFGPDYTGSVEWTVLFEEIPIEHKTCKIGGLSAIYPAMLWPPTARRVERYGMGEWPDWAHENGWRWIGHMKGGDEVSLSTYTYTDARGGIGPPEQEKPESVGLGRIGKGEKARLRIEVRETDVLYECTTPRLGKQSHTVPLECSPWMFWKHFAHSSGVTPDTPEPITFRIWKGLDT